MKVYAIHRENVWTTDYNVIVFSSKRKAQKTIKELNVKFSSWEHTRGTLGTGTISDYRNSNYMDFVYNNPQPPKYRLQEIEVLTK